MSETMNTSSRFFVLRRTWLSRKPWEGAGLTAAATWLFVAFATLAEWNDWFGAELWMPATGRDVFGYHEWWRAWTTVLVHGDFGHFLSNSLLLVVFGFLIAGYFGRWVFPFGAFLGGGLINLIAIQSYDPRVTLIGASGVVYELGGFWLVLYALLSREKTVMQRFLRSMGVALALFMPSEAFNPVVSYRTHAIGFAVGAIAGLAFYLWNRRKFLAAEEGEWIVEEPEELPPTVDDSKTPWFAGPAVAAAPWTPPAAVARTPGDPSATRARDDS